MKKVTLNILFIFVLFLTFLQSANAAPIDNNCINDKTCITLCNYQNVLQLGGSYSSGYQKREINRNITIYYYFKTQEFSIQWQSTDAKGTTFSKGPLALSILFSKKGTNVYWAGKKDLNINTFTCPEHGFLDNSDLMNDNELCFDDDGSTCIKNYNNMGTAFGKNMISEKKDYDFEEQILNYQNWTIQDIASEISQGEISTDKISEKIRKDFQDNFLYGNLIPKFMENSEAFTSLNNSVKDEYEKYKKTEIAKANNKLKTGAITEEEYKQIVNNWSASGETVSNDVTKMFDSISNNQVIKDWEISSDDKCNSILGRVDDSTTPAYYLDFAFKLIKYAAIIYLIVLTIIEYVKAITSQDAEALKKATRISLRRVILCVIIYSLPILINFIFKILGFVDSPTCGIGSGIK